MRYLNIRPLIVSSALSAIAHAAYAQAPICVTSDSHFATPAGAMRCRTDIQAVTGAIPHSALVTLQAIRPAALTAPLELRRFQSNMGSHAAALHFGGCASVKRGVAEQNFTNGVEGAGVTG